MAVSHHRVTLVLVAEARQVAVAQFVERDTEAACRVSDGVNMRTARLANFSQLKSNQSWCA
jgi:hypothetical protein